MIVHLITGLIKKTQSSDCIKISQYFPKPYEPFGGDINSKVDLRNYATKKDIKKTSYVDISSFALKSNLASLKTKVYKLDIDKLVSVPVDLTELSVAVKNDVVKKTWYDNLVAKVNSTYARVFVSKTKYDTDKNELQKKFLVLVVLFKKKTDYNTIIIEIDGKIPSITGFTTNFALTAIENKIPNISSLYRKINEIEKKLTGQSW